MGGISHTCIPHNPRGLFPVCFLPPRESFAFSLAPPAAPPTEPVVSLTVLPAPLAVLPTLSVTPVAVSPSPFPRPASGYQTYSESHFDRTPTTDQVASSICYTCRAISIYMRESRRSLPDTPLPTVSVTPPRIPPGGRSSSAGSKFYGKQMGMTESKVREKHTTLIVGRHIRGV
jgi:hypothetical protein